MIKRIVLTGGPCAGKTTILSKLEQDLSEKGYKVFIVSESATELINSGITPHIDNVGLLNFQKIIFEYQYYKEEMFNKVVDMYKDDKIVIIYDRGLMDNMAYIDDSEFEMIVQNFCVSSGINLSISDILNRYDMVIHLVTSAGNTGYSLENNKARYESEKEAISLDNRIMNVWITHNNLKIVDNKDNFDDKVSEVLDLVYSCVGETLKIKKEKKFLVNGLIPSKNISDLNGSIMEIEQYYMATEFEEECRVRKIEYKYGRDYYYTIQKKDKNGKKIVLFEKNITRENFLHLLDFEVVSSVFKKRICFTYSGQFCKLDLFSDGLMLLEVEYNNDIDQIVVPEYFNILKDVTNDDEYKNINIGDNSSEYLVKILRR